MPYNCLIIDDNYAKSHELKLLLEAQGSVQHVFATVHPYQINTLLVHDGIDVVFIKAKLWEHRLFTSVYALKKKPTIVFISPKKERNKHAEVLDVKHQVREPYMAKDLHQLFISIFKDTVEENWNFFFIKYERRYLKVFFDDIVLLENKPKSCYVMLHTRKGKFMIKDTLSDLLARLPEDIFLRISDELIIPVENKSLIHHDVYPFEGREIQLTYRYMKQLEKKELNIMEVMH